MSGWNDSVTFKVIDMGGMRKVIGGNCVCGKANHAVWHIPNTATATFRRCENKLTHTHLYGSQTLFAFTGADDSFHSAAIVFSDTQNTHS